MDESFGSDGGDFLLSPTHQHQNDNLLETNNENSSSNNDNKKAAAVAERPAVSQANIGPWVAPQ